MAAVINPENVKMEEAHDNTENTAEKMKDVQEVEENKSQKEDEESSDEKMDVVKDLQARTGFTSEEFKIELNGLPKFFGIGQAKKLLRSKGVDYHKIKPAGKNMTYLFVNFKDEELREKAIAILNGVTVKGKPIRAFKAKAAKDPMLRRQEERDNQVPDTRPIKEQIIGAVCPLALEPYEKQLESKQKQVIELMDTLR